MQCSYNVLSFAAYADHYVVTSILIDPFRSYIKDNPQRGRCAALTEEPTCVLKKGHRGFHREASPRASPVRPIAACCEARGLSGWRATPQHLEHGHRRQHQLP